MGASVPTNSKTLTTFSIIPEIEAPPFVPYGDWCVEFAHDLGIPDMFNTTASPYCGLALLGPWDLMDKGSWNSDGWLPAHVSAWEKIKLGFISGPMIATAQPGETSTFTVAPAENASGGVHVIKILLNNANPARYYLVETRALEGFDAGLPAPGVLITYVDETLPAGKVHVIDGDPGIPLLINAVWTVDQTFTDTKNNLSVTINAQIGNSYKITVNRQTSPIVSSAISLTSQNNSNLPTTQIRIQDVTLTVQLATTPAEQTQGLSGVPSMSANQGMLFVFDHQDYWTFWMIDMKFPLDIIWFNSARQVVFMEQNLQPCTPDNCPTYTPDASAKYVLEVNAGFAAAHHVTYGTTFTFLNANQPSSSTQPTHSHGKATCDYAEIIATPKQSSSMAVSR
jgi:uncharacterized membrane protein (UPF0127 family)